MEGKIKQLFHFQRHHMILAGYWLTILRELLLSSPFGETGFWSPPPSPGVFPPARPPGAAVLSECVGTTLPSCVKHSENQPSGSLC